MRFYTFSLTLLSQFKLEAFPRIYDLPITFLNWPSIQLNTHITRNRTNYRIRLRVRFYFFPHTTQPIQIQSFSTNIRSPYNLSQLAEIQLNIHTTKNSANTEL